MGTDLDGEACVAEFAVLDIVIVSWTATFHRPTKNCTHFTGVQLDACLLVILLVILRGKPAEVLWAAIKIFIAAITSLAVGRALIFPRPVQTSLAEVLWIAVCMMMASVTTNKTLT